MPALHDKIDTFNAAVQTYSDRIEMEQHDLIEKADVTDYIEEELVPAWQEAAKAADKIHNALATSNGTEELTYTEASRRWIDYIDAEQTITAHEQYTRTTYDTSPVQYRLSIDPDYRDRLDLSEHDDAYVS